VRILAIETTEAMPSVAAIDAGKLLLELKLESPLRSAQSLAPGLKTLLEQIAWKATDVQLVAVTVGPGSFTGLRVGVTTAKTFAYAAQAEVLGIDTLESIAAAAPADVPLLSVAVDAQRGEVVAGLFRRNAEGWFEPLERPQLVEIDAWLRGLPAGAAVTGPVLRKLVERVPEGIRILAPQYWPATAAATGRLAVRFHAAGRRDNLWTLVPRYSRRSAAEEKRDAAGPG
jgi:tRNA threonylcarbamoyladenosine biosynthesis protein TsaB